MQANRIIVSPDVKTNNFSENICLNESVKCFNGGDCVPLTELNSLGFKCLCKANFSGLFCETSNYQLLKY